MGDEDQKANNKWTELFQYDANNLSEDRLRAVFNEKFDFPFVDHFLCAFKYWEELRRNMRTVTKDDLRAFVEDARYKKCIKRINKEEVYKTLMADITDFGIPD